MEKKIIFKKLKEIESQVFMDENMGNHVSFRAGGNADFYVEPSTEDHLIAVLKFCKEQTLPYYLMGNGSNILVRDGGYAGIIINTTHLRDIQIQEACISAQAGASLSVVAQQALIANLEGLAFASGIPGTVGGAVVMNAGAYGNEIKNVLESVEVLNENFEKEVFLPDQCDLGYRNSIFRHKNYIILRVNIKLSKGDYNKIKNEMADLNHRRSEKQPLSFPSAGSTFKRPEGYYAGKLIDDCGLRGHQLGGAQVSEKHCGFIINKTNATATEIEALIAFVQKKVKQDFNVDMQTEVILIGKRR